MKPLSKKRVASIMNTSILGIDLAKNSFHVCGLNQANKIQFNRKLIRNKLTVFMQQKNPVIIAMEACSSSNYRARKFEEIGHTVKLVDINQTSTDDQ